MIINPYVFGAGSGGPFTAALLHCEGTAGSTVFTDEVSGNSWANDSGSASVISTTQHKFGSSSISFPSASTGALLGSFNAGLDLLNALAWTIEMFVYLTSAGDRRIFCLGGTTTNFNTTTGIHILLGLSSSVLQL